MSDEHEVKKVFDFYADSEEGVVKTPFGEDQGDLKELFEVADFFAGRYGMGGCRSLEEFVEMINNTDPFIVNMFKAVAVDKNQRELDEMDTNKPKGGIDSNKPKDDARQSVPTKFGKTSPARPTAPIRTPIKVGTGAGGINRANMKRFLLTMGASPDGIKEACGRLDGRKMELRDYSHLDSRTLKTMSREEFKETLRNISKDIKSSENFEVSDDTLRARIRKQVNDARHQS